MGIKADFQALRAKFDPFSVTARWDVETEQWTVGAQKHENGDEHHLAADETLGGAFKKAATRRVGRSWRAE